MLSGGLMKYFLAILASLFILGCASSQKQSDTSKYDTQKGVVDQEFDLLIAPEYDYESDVPYAEQIKVTTKNGAYTSSQTIQTTKSMSKPSATKVK